MIYRALRQEQWSQFEWLLSLDTPASHSYLWSPLQDRGEKTFFLNSHSEHATLLHRAVTSIMEAFMLAVGCLSVRTAASHH